MKKNDLETRMKEYYEKRCRIFLPRRTNTIIRIDGKAFHTYTKKLNKPFDEGLMEDMLQTTIYLCENIQGCKMGYTQSDEISLLLTDYDSLQTQAYFDGAVDKICSISASYATAKFNQLTISREIEYYQEEALTPSVTDFLNFPLAQFDARCFTIPEQQEVVNYFIWRQRDAERNSIQSLAQSLYSDKELKNKSTSELQELCFQKGQNWNDLSVPKKRGSFVVRNEYWDDIQVTTLNKKVKSNGNIYYNISEDIFYTVPTKLVPRESIKIRTRWEYEETPIFSQNKLTILNLFPTF